MVAGIILTDILTDEVNRPCKSSCRGANNAPDQDVAGALGRFSKGIMETHRKYQDLAEVMP